MLNKRLLTATLVLLLCLTSVAFVQNSFAFAGESVYTVTGDTYDAESGDLSYRKVEYSVDTNGEYVSFPCSYEGKYTDETCVSIKYKNGGVSSIPVYMEYGSGINDGGVDYAPGEEIICMDMLDPVASWNVSYSKSIDGYDVVTIIFGNYTANYHDMMLTGFRLYFDDGKTVSSSKSFEVYGLTVHEQSATPSFASDPKPCRIGKITSTDVLFENNSCKVEGTVTLNAPILDFDNEYKKIKVGFTVNDGVTVELKLDGESLLSAQYGVGSHEETLDFTKQSYSELQIVITANGAKFTLDHITLVSTPYVDDFTGSNFTITKEGDGSTKVVYDFKMGWNSIKAPIRRYTSDYDRLLIEFTIDTPIVMGIMIDEEYLRSHWEYKEPLAAGDHSMLFQLSGMNISASSSLEIWLDPAITGYAGVEGDKTVLFKNIEFTASAALPKATISGLQSEFNYVYDGEGKKASGATTNSGETLVYEYKPVDAKESAYDTDLPVDAGEYDVRVTSPSNMNYATTYAYAKLYITKANAPTPTASCITIDYENSVVNYDGSLFAVSRAEDFSSIILSGDAIAFGDELFIKYIESNNYSESQPISLLLDSREGSVTVGINYQRETTLQAIEEDTEYSKDGLNWTAGAGKRVTLEPGNIYLFRKRATESSFAGEITYIAVNYRPEAPAAPVLESTTSNSITVVAVEGAEYRLSDSVWQADPTFTGLKNGTEVTVYIRIKGSSESYASEEVSATFTVGKVSSESSINSSSEQKSGCGSSMLAGGGLFAILLVAGAILAIKRGKGE